MDASSSAMLCEMFLQFNDSNSILYMCRAFLKNSTSAVETAFNCCSCSSQGQLLNSVWARVLRNSVSGGTCGDGAWSLLQSLL
jgi:hypothetical protein